MWRWLLLVVLAVPQLAQGMELADATGRQVQLPDRIARVLPAGPPAAVLLAALAPDLMVGWPHPPSAAARAFLPDALAAVRQMHAQLAGLPSRTGEILELKSIKIFPTAKKINLFKTHVTLQQSISF